MSDVIGGKTAGDLSFTLLKALLALIETRSVTHAARDLQVSQGAVSHSLKRLRDIFNDPLFVFEKGELKPTERCLALQMPAAALLADATALMQSASDFDPEHMRRTISLTLNEVGEVAILPDFMHLVAEQAHHCTVATCSFKDIDVPARMADGSVDLAVGRIISSSHDILQQTLYSQRFAVIAHPSIGLPPTISLEDYADLRHAAYRSTRSITVEIDRHLERIGRKREIVLQTPHAMVLPFIVAATPGLSATIPKVVADRRHGEGKFSVSAVEEPCFSTDISLFWHRRFDNDPYNRWLRSLMRQAIVRSKLETSGSLKLSLMST